MLASCDFVGCSAQMPTDLLSQGVCRKGAKGLSLAFKHILRFRHLKPEIDWGLRTASCAPLFRPQGRCWVEDDLDGRSDDSRTKFGAVPLALVQVRPGAQCIRA